MKRVLISIPEGNVRKTFMPQEVCAYLEQHFDVTYNTVGRQFNKEELRALLPEFDAIMTGWTHPMLDEEVLEGNDKLKLIVHTGGTVGNLVDDYAYKKGITVFSGNKLYAESVAEGTLAYILMGLRRIPDYVNRIREGEWRVIEDIWEGLLDKTVGIIGLGSISRILIQMLQPFHVKIKVFSHYGIEEEFIEKYGCEQVSLADIFSTCDIVTVHSALNEQNRGLIQKEHFEQMKEGSLFINTARSAVINEDALIEELKKNRFRAVLDVFGKEPLAEDSELRRLQNVYCIPHMAGPTLDRRKWIAKALIDEMRAFFDGEEVFDLEISEEYAKRMTKR